MSTVPNPPTTAMVFAAGYGERMRPLTEHTPKPMLKVCGKPLIDYNLDMLVKAGVKRAVVNTHYLAEQVENHVTKRTDIEIVISHEETLLDTGGGVVNALPYLGEEPFYIINSDIILLDGSAPTLLRLANAWDEKQMDALLLLEKLEDAIGYHGKGDFDIGKDGAIIRRGAKENPYVYVGAQIIHPKILQGQPIRPFPLFSKQLYFSRLQKDGRIERVHGLAHDGTWLHVGDPDALAAAETYI